MPKYTPIPAELLNLECPSPINLPNLPIPCDWAILSTQLQVKWPRLSQNSIDHTLGNLHQIATLISQNYNMSEEMAENYLANYKRTMPLH